jgi:hypothetical protein
VKIFLPQFTEKDALPDGAVTEDDLKAWDAEFNNICELINPLFYRADSRAHAVRYLRGLLAPLERKNAWTMSEFTGLHEPKALQRFLNLTQWDSDKLRDIVRSYAIEHFADSRGVLIADPTGFAKKGRKSAGVQRQYSGTLGRIDNCQIGTFLAYANTSGDRLLIDRELYIPEKSWFGEPDRCAEAGIPEDLAFRTRPQQVEAMIKRALDAGTPFAWFTADEEPGPTPIPGEKQHLLRDGNTKEHHDHHQRRPHSDHRGNRQENTLARMAAPRLRNRQQGIPGLRLGTNQHRRARPPVHDQAVHRRRGTRLLHLPQPARGRTRRAHQDSRNALAGRGVIRGSKKRGRNGQLPGPPLPRMVPAHHHGNARPRLSRRHET